MATVNLKNLSGGTAHSRVIRSTSTCSEATSLKECSTELRLTWRNQTVQVGADEWKDLAKESGGHEI